MFKIGEFSRLTQVTIRMLRYYDEMGLLKPAEIDPWTGYRLYSVEQLPVLNKIIYLRDSGFQIAEIAAALAGQDDTLLIRQLDKKHAEIDNIIRMEQEKLTKIELAKKELLTDKSELHYQISMKTIPGCQVLSLRRIISDYYAEGELWKELAAFAKQNLVSVTEPTFSVYHDTEYKEKDVDVELCVPVRKKGQDMGSFVYREIEPVPSMACTMVYGPFSNIAGAYLAFAGWLGKNENYQMSIPTRQIVHRGPWNETNPENYLTELQIPVDMR
ncbi:MAG: MerR family transcriptional regulator [Lachnospiraceae bacterium]